MLFARKPSLSLKTVWSHFPALRCYNTRFSKYQAKTPSSSAAAVPEITGDDLIDDFQGEKSIYATKQLKDAVNTMVLRQSKTSDSTVGRENETDWTTSFKGLSVEPFSEKACKILQEPISKSDIEIKPDGILYLPEIKYRRILNKAFGPGAWGLVPRSEAVVINGNIVTRDYALLVLGRLVSLCSGEQTFFGDDQIITSLEGCKSNALMRCCKDLGIASELWDPIFIAEFKNKWCKAQIVEHIKTKAKKRVWMKNTDTTAPYPFKLCK